MRRCPWVSWLLGSVALLLAFACAAASVPSAASAVAVTEFSKDIGRPGPLVAGPDGALWFGADGYVGRITTDGRVSRYLVGHPSDAVHALAVGSDGRIWFTDPTSLLVGAVTVTGQVTQYRFTPLSDSSDFRPRSIAAGPDGALWFTAGVPAVGRITTDGQVSFFTKGIPGEVDEIAAGPGGLWFPVPDHRGIWRITTAGEVTGFSGHFSPFAMAAGPDGNMWFSEFDRRVVGRITPAGAITEFPTTAEAFPTIARGQGQELWFSSPDGCPTYHDDEATVEPCILGRITTNGRVTRFTGGVLAHAGIGGIAPGPDGNIWFSELTAGRIGRLDLAACGGMRRVVLHPRKRWPTLKTATASLDGESIPVQRQSLNVTVDLRLHPRGIAVVRVHGRTRSGRKVTDRKTFNICSPA
jgi:streptogramin lyase